MREKNLRSWWLYAFLTVLCAASLAAPAALRLSAEERRSKAFCSAEPIWGMTPPKHVSKLSF
jgi:hypothetical protein